VARDANGDLVVSDTDVVGVALNSASVSEPLYFGTSGKVLLNLAPSVGATKGASYGPDASGNSTDAATSLLAVALEDANTGSRVLASVASIGTGSGGGTGGATGATSIGSQRVLDQFTDANGTAITSHTPTLATGGQAWTEALRLSTATPTVPAAEIQSNALQLNANDNGAVVNLSTPDASVALTWTPETGQLNRFSVVLRYVSPGNLIAVNIREDEGDIQIQEYVNDVITTVASRFLTITEGVAHTVTVNLIGYSCNVEVAEVATPISNRQELPAIVTAHSGATRFGLVRNTSSTFPTFDNFSAVGLTIPTTAVGGTGSPDPQDFESTTSSLAVDASRS
jgi:hypothetical protein